MYAKPRSPARPGRVINLGAGLENEKKRARVSRFTYFPAVGVLHGHLTEEEEDKVVLCHGAHEVRGCNSSKRKMTVRGLQ